MADEDLKKNVKKVVKSHPIKAAEAATGLTGNPMGVKAAMDLGKEVKEEAEKEFAEEEAEKKGKLDSVKNLAKKTNL